MSFTQLAIICAIALIGPLLALPKTFRLPVVIGELFIGILLGRTGFGILTPENVTFSFLGEIGFALVMLVAGSHVPIRSAAMRTGFVVGAARAAGIAVVSVAAGLALAAAFGTGHGLLYAVLIASSSAAIVMPMLEDLPLTGASMVAVLPQIAVADAMCIVLIPLVLDPSQVWRAVLGAVVLGAMAIVLWLLLGWAERSGRRKAVHAVSEERGLAIELRSVLVGLFIMAAVAQWLHVSAMLAGFATGLAVAAVGTPRRVHNQLFALTEGFFAPIFFVWLGASLDLRELLDHPSAIVLGIALGVVALLVHGLGALFGQPWPVAVTTGAQLGVPIAAAALATQQGALDPGEPPALLLGALVTILVVSALNRRVGVIARREAAAAGASP